MRSCAKHNVYRVYLLMVSVLSTKSILVLSLFMVSVVSATSIFVMSLFVDGVSSKCYVNPRDQVYLLMVSLVSAMSILVIESIC